MWDDLENVSLKKMNIDSRLNYISTSKRLADMLCSNAIFFNRMYVRRVQCMCVEVRNDLENGPKKCLWHSSLYKHENIGNNLPESAKN